MCDRVYTYMHVYDRIYLSLHIYLFLVIEKFTENTRFCLICNYLSKIIPAIQSRCTRFRFGPLAKEQMVSRLEYVIAQERYVHVCTDGSGWLWVYGFVHTYVLVAYVELL